ncbi:alpha/beta-hydrolase [Meira miltonrushii]|uniref:Alpha/beta-hydrolase n=1 Tax=Meira miltonrushii TaxID=1280837 RepID=A0A316V6S6_9BASI|nr:alpha/beta-hydrolase [Meira miltonrushii]PWN32738.1 alpha/beta-hydrolase [Meira miltonrushii]
MTRTETDPSTVPTGWRTHYPGKIVWSFLCAISALIYLIAMLFINIIPSWRSNRHWSYTQAFLGSIIKFVSTIITHLRIVDSLDLNPGKLGDRFIVIQPAPLMVYTEHLKSESVTPKPIGATWYPSVPSKEELEGSKIVLWFHSGSFIYLTGRPSDSDKPARSLNSCLGPKTFSLWVQYRLAECKNDPTPFPGPMQDALTSYLYLTQELSIDPCKIIVGGDSSGATMAIGLVRYLQVYRNDKAKMELPYQFPTLPHACIMLSPSVDYCTEADVEELSTHRNVKLDYLVPQMLAWGSHAFAPPPIDLDSPYISPVRYPFSTTVPIYVQSGGAEILCDTIRSFVKIMQDIKGNKLEYFEMPHAPHDVFAIGYYAGWKKEALMICEEVAGFISRLNEQHPVRRSITSLPADPIPEDDREQLIDPKDVILVDT